MRSLLIIAALSVSACSSLPAVPEALAPGPGKTLALTASARGVQIYECRVRSDGKGFDWTFVAPEAELLDAAGRRSGLHGVGPFWQATDGSRVLGTVTARADAPAADAIPWLLLTTTSTGALGVLSGVTHIQRINTVGGKAPTAPCTQALLGGTERVPYRADYLFFTDR